MKKMNKCKQRQWVVVPDSIYFIPREVVPVIWYSCRKDLFRRAKRLAREHDELLSGVLLHTFPPIICVSPEFKITRHVFLTDSYLISISSEEESFRRHNLNYPDHLMRTRFFKLKKVDFESIELEEMLTCFIEHDKKVRELIYDLSSKQKKIEAFLRTKAYESIMI